MQQLAQLKERCERLTSQLEAKSSEAARLNSKFAEQSEELAQVKTKVSFRWIHHGITFISLKLIGIFHEMSMPGVNLLQTSSKTFPLFGIIFATSVPEMFVTTLPHQV